MLVIVNVNAKPKIINVLVEPIMPSNVGTAMTKKYRENRKDRKNIQRT